MQYPASSTHRSLDSPYLRPGLEKIFGPTRPVGQVV